MLNRTIDDLERERAYSNKMLPSSFRRTSTYLGNNKLDKSISTVGPADYEKERILGNETNT